MRAENKFAYLVSVPPEVERTILDGAHFVSSDKANHGKSDDQLKKSLKSNTHHDEERDRKDPAFRHHDVQQCRSHRIGSTSACRIQNMKFLKRELHSEVSSTADSDVTKRPIATRSGDVRWL
ncbi:hypothetical protein PHYPSEUDO_000834 [Phytophthora pseudosyringae]|uniref:Uncharacterized protein n=1 Tax=Phytophthora pseudosyringae TaxID=221518 RepID=A0A8T1WG86_9STRA|nr:hypothetical protein PHYPSEUDO_000834 [Phytophthora pseudosyringae]